VAAGYWRLAAGFIKIEKDETGRLHPFTKTNQTN